MPLHAGMPCSVGFIRTSVTAGQQWSVVGPVGIVLLHAMHGMHLWGRKGQALWLHLVSLVHWLLA